MEANIMLLLWCYVISLLLAIVGSNEVKQTNRLWCPPLNFLQHHNKSIKTMSTALITEVNGQHRGTGSNWGELQPGELVSRNLFNHIAIMGIDKVYLNVLYNDTLFPTLPTVNDIYPASQYCVEDWFNLGLLIWRPIPFAGPIERWPLDDKGLPSLDKDLYKTLRGFNPIYSEIMNTTDWIFVMDIDEYLLPLHYAPARSDWCSHKYNSIVASTLDQMLITATKRNLETFKIIKETKSVILSNELICPLGYGLHNKTNSCRPITAFSMPIYVWLNDINDDTATFPSRRSKYPCAYATYTKNVSKEPDNFPQRFKSVYQTKYNPPLQGRSMHVNGADKTFPLMAPRIYHGGLTFQLAHIRTHNHGLDNGIQHLIKDNRLNELSKLYSECMNKLLN